ncbi:MAG: Ribonuclease HII [Candidatus Diapherotrites archaeon ADurb.Bin253]|jgi:ribonuclease HII|nr:ribonuclease HII [Candidatus Pacearchaeota archaeon]OQA68610.1 MAG: Ribonuclease HII [Candidatus Diapherotrites archaeon ADurb.Bin253]HNZ52033.1 ribonuclease HII [Candidatus Pacearchaeota archaeon]HOF44124.1 ribonuclease HII [Candidatus Pacearchaeota archaeon]HOH04115.1 ribonuclease HII [Candidatus Pacearchaeota archaeon]
MGDFILGIDEAGKGPVIGPMVIAGCLIDTSIEREFKRLGIKDSKELTPKRREFLANIVREKAETFEIIVVHPKEIDKSLNSGMNLNNLESRKIAEIINKINKGYKKIKVVIDCPSVGVTKWVDALKMKINNLSNLEITCEHKADKNYVAVSAASILAKSIREKEMNILREKYGDEIGSGYTSDPATIHFLELHADNPKNASIFRKTWETWKKASEKLTQKKLI